MKYSNLLGIVMLIISSLHLSGQDIDIYGEMYPILSELEYIGEYGDFDFQEVEKALQTLKGKGLEFRVIKEKKFKAISTHDPARHKLKMQTYSEDKRRFTIQVLTGATDSLQSFFQNARPQSGSWTGYESYYQRFVYMLRDTSRNSFAGSMLISNNAILSITQPVEFKVTGRASTMNEEEKAIAKASFNQILTITQALGDYLVPEKSRLFKMSDEGLTAEERIYGFTQFWTEVKYNFAFFDQVPDLNWDEVYLDYLPMIMEDQSNVEYFRLMEKICALLHDGHTNIYPPNNLPVDHPELALINIGGRAIVRNMSVALRERIPKGTEVVAVDGIDVQTYLKEKIIPYVSSSTEHVLMNDAIRNMLQGSPNSSVEIRFKSIEGKEWKETLSRTRNSGNMEWALEWPNFQWVEFKDLGNSTAHVALNGFGSDKAVEGFESLLDTLQFFDHFIIDLRNNGGGNSGTGYAILKYFADKPFLTSNWRTREHKGAYKAWGSQFANSSEEGLTGWALESKQTFDGTYWHVGEPDTISPQKTLNFKGNLIVLIGNNTASAAEDFLVALDDLGIGILIGQPTYGSTGQPLMVKLPRGGSARICTKKDTYPDGREFVGYGIQPDILVQKTVQDYISGRDIELEAALKHIRSNNK